MISCTIDTVLRDTLKLLVIVDDAPPHRAGSRTATASRPVGTATADDGTRIIANVSGSASISLWNDAQPAAAAAGLRRRRRPWRGGQWSVDGTWRSSTTDYQYAAAEEKHQEHAAGGNGVDGARDGGGGGSHGGGGDEGGGRGGGGGGGGGGNPILAEPTEDRSWGLCAVAMVLILSLLLFTALIMFSLLLSSQRDESQWQQCLAVVHQLCGA